MNQFIHATNQSTLWKVINNVAQVQYYFAGAPPGAKEKWFQTHIGQIYQMYYGSTARLGGVDVLQSLNKKAIDIMIASLVPPMVSREAVQPREQSSRAAVPPRETLEQTPLPPQTPQVMQLPGQAIKTATMDEFSRRQAEYDAMVAKQTPVANFSEPIKDDAIIDLTSAVEQYKRMRDPEPIELQVEEIVSPLSSREQSSLERTASSTARETPVSLERHVQWSNTNQEHDHFETRILNILSNIEKDIADIKSRLENIVQNAENKI